MQEIPINATTVDASGRVEVYNKREDIQSSLFNTVTISSKPLLYTSK